MKEHLLELIHDALRELKRSGELDIDPPASIPIERTRDSAHGDYATPICLALAKTARRNPRALAQLLITRIPASEQVAKVEIAGAGFINFFLANSALTAVVSTILGSPETYGRGEFDTPPRVQVEFVSANPTGPLHVGHGRGAAYGAALAALLEYAGFDVQREYYVNDAGRQMNILALSVWLRYLEHFGKRLDFPVNGYRGGYIREFAKQLASECGDTLVAEPERITQGLPPDEAQGGDKELYVDALIERCINLLGRPAFDQILAISLHEQIAEIRADLHDFGIDYDCWFSEKSLVDDGTVERVIADLEKNGHLYRQDGHLWFRSTHYGDEKDRVVVRSNGVGTYFASDIAYLRNKFERGFDHIIYVWGADHHGYIARLKAACRALGYDSESVEILLVQFANLYQGGQKIPMSTRSGEFVTLRELRGWVGRDAARFFYEMRRSDQHLDFDLDLARKRTEENPVFYVQYAHARVQSILRNAGAGAADVHANFSGEHAALLTHENEQGLCTQLSSFPEVVQRAASEREPHQIAFYMRDLATAFHGYYNTPGLKILADEQRLQFARLGLCIAVASVLRTGLQILGVSAPDEM